MLEVRNLSSSEVLLEGTEELLLLRKSLVRAVTKFGRRVDPFEVDLLERTSSGVDEHGFAESHDSLLDTWNGAFKQDEVVLDLTVAHEASQWCNVLLGDVELCGSIALIVAFSNAVDLVVDRRTMMVTLLTCTGNSPLDVGRMPCTDTGDLPQTLVCLARQLLCAPTSSDTGITVTLGNGNDVDHLVLLEDGADVDRLLEKTVAEVDLVSDGATIDLDLHQVGLLLLEWCLADLGVCEDADDGAVLLDALEFASDGRALVVGVLLGVLGECLLLALVPVLVESPLNLVAQVLSPDGGE